MLISEGTVSRESPVEGIQMEVMRNDCLEPLYHGQRKEMSFSGQLISTKAPMLTDLNEDWKFHLDYQPFSQSDVSPNAPKRYVIQLATYH